MKIVDWKRIRKIEEMIESKGLRVGDKFLTGKSMINQLENKKVGDVISYFKIINIGKNVEYMLITDKLEEI